MRPFGVGGDWWEEGWILDPSVPDSFSFFSTWMVRAESGSPGLHDITWVE